MSHHDLLVREIKHWLMSVRPEQGPEASADSYNAETLNALRSILVEIEQASVFVAITTSICGAMREGLTTALTSQHLAGYTPESPKVYQQQIDRLLSSGMTTSILLPVQAYHTRLSFALRLTRAVVEAGPAPSHAVRGTEFEKLEEAWQHVCGTALIAIGVLREALASVRYTRPPVNNEHAEALLRSAKAGGRPCVGKDGSITMPRWAESRSHARQVTQQAATLWLDGLRQQVLIENASRTGLGLSGIKNCPSGARVTVETQSGERHAGRIMWERDGRAGLHLDVMLPAAHALIGKSSAGAEH